MEEVLVIAMFIATALSLNFMVGDRKKSAGAMNIINLCLIVAVAYQFKLVHSIIVVLIIAAIAVVGCIILWQRFKSKKTMKVVDAKVIETKEK